MPHLSARLIIGRAVRDAARVITVSHASNGQILRRLAGPNVRFLGWISPEELRAAVQRFERPRYLADFKAFVECNLGAVQPSVSFPLS